MRVFSDYLSTNDSFELSREAGRQLGEEAYLGQKDTQVIITVKTAVKSLFDLLLSNFDSLLSSVNEP